MRRTASSQSNHYCHAIECVTRCKPEYLMCPRHWHMVPANLQATVYACYRKGQCDDMNPSKAWVIAAKAAIRVVAEKEMIPEAQIERDAKEWNKFMATLKEEVSP